MFVTCRVPDLLWSLTLNQTRKYTAPADKRGLFCYSRLELSWTSLNLSWWRGRNYRCWDEFFPSAKMPAVFPRRFIFIFLRSIFILEISWLFICHIILANSRRNVHWRHLWQCHIEDTGVMKLRNHWSFPRVVPMISRKFKRSKRTVRKIQTLDMKFWQSLLCEFNSDD